MATEDPGVSPDLRSPPGPGLRPVREGGSRSSQGGGGSRPGKGARGAPQPREKPAPPTCPAVPWPHAAPGPAPAGASTLGDPSAVPVPGGRAGGRVGASPASRRPGIGLGPSALAAREQPGSYRGVSREAAAAAVQLLFVRSGLGASPAASAQSRGSRPAARSAVAAGARRARVRAGPAAATGAPCCRRCRRLW